MNTEAAKVGRQASTAVWALFAVAVALVVVAASLLYIELRTPERWDPLGDYPTQQVLSRVPGVEGPATTAHGTVDVTATKCSNADEPIEIDTELAWRSVDPGGAAWSRGHSQAVRDPGCTSLRFDNPIPPQVRALVAAQHDAGYPAPVWQIVGVETPVRHNGTEGVETRWRTENFTIVDR